MPVNTIHAEYAECLPLWALVRGSIAGEDAIKKAGETYLPRANGHTSDAYSRYLARAHYAMFTARAADGLYGQIFSKPPERIGGDALGDLLGNVDKAGSSIDQFASDLCWDIMQTGWGGILADHSPVPQGMSQAEKERAGLSSFLRWYNAESVINWRYDSINDRQELALVVLKEDYADAGKDKFSPALKTRYRVLELIDGTYTQEVWEKTSNGVSSKDEFQPVAQFAPLLGGKPLDFIPFFPCPAKSPEKSMLLPIAYLNIEHYQLTADYVNILHYTGTPTPYVLGSDPPKDKNGSLIPVTIGGSNFIFIPATKDISGAVIAPSIGFLEPSGAGARQLLESLQAIEKNMEALGANIVKEDKKGVETADAARIHQAGENAVLGSFSLNMSERITQAVRLAARWRGVPAEIAEGFSYSLNMDYEGEMSSADEAILALRERDSGAMSLWRYLTDISGLSEEEAEAEVRRIREEDAGRFALPENKEEENYAE